MCFSHPVSFPRHHQQPLAGFGLPCLQSGRGWAAGSGGGGGGGARGDGGGLRWLRGGGGGRGDGRSRLRGGGGGGVPVGGRQAQEELVAPLPLVAFGAVAGVGRLPLLRALAPAAVAMETGAAGTRICEKLGEKHSEENRKSQREKRSK